MTKHTPKGPPHKNERAAILHLKERLPDSFHVFTNLELAVERRHASTYEHDAVVLTPYMVFAVELKHWGGAIRAGRDRWTLDDGTIKNSPVKLQLQKARALKSAFGNRDHCLQRDFWVQGVIFLTKRDAQPEVHPEHDGLVFTWDQIIEALQDHQRWGRGQQLTRQQLKHATRYLHDGDPRRVQSQRFPNFKLHEQLATADNCPYEMWRGERYGNPRTLHIYRLDGRNDTQERRLQERANREVHLQERLRGGPDLLTYFDADRLLDTPERAYILNFEDVRPLLPLMEWVRELEPPPDARLEVGRRIAVALKHIHARRLVHRRLSPDAVLVSAEAYPQVVKLCAVELARDLTQALATVASTVLDDPTFRYMAPEQLNSREATELSDLFSLGVTLFELINERPMFDKADDVLRTFTVPPLHVADTPLPPVPAEAIAGLINIDPLSRTPLDTLIEALSPARPAPIRQPAGPVFAPDAEVGEVALVRSLRQGDVQVWLARDRHDGSAVVAKIGPPGHQALLDERDALQPLHHPNIVRYRYFKPIGDTHTMLVVDTVDGCDGAEHAGAGDPIGHAQIQRVGRGLFAALGALHNQNWLHRDVKPENLLLRDPDLDPVLIDFGLATRTNQASQLICGTPEYKDPWLYEVGQWEPRDDLFSAWLTLYEVTTGFHPFNGQPTRDAEPQIRASDFADSVNAETRERLASCFQKALGPPEGRPQSAADASRALDEALVGTSLSLTMPSGVSLRPGVGPETPIEALGLGVRAFRALNRLGVRVAHQVQRVEPGMLRSVRNVGKKTIAEIMAVRAALDEALGVTAHAVQVVQRVRPLAPQLIDDPRPLSELGRALTKKLHAHFNELGITTIGELAGLPERLLSDLDGVGTGRVDKLHAALRRLAGSEAGPSDLADLHEQLRAELKKGFDALDAAYGLSTGDALTFEDAATALGLTRQRVHQAIDLDALRAGGSVASHLVMAMEEALPSCGFAPLPAAAEALGQRLYARPEGPSPVGYARLAAMLMRAAPERRVWHAHVTLDVVFRPPWHRVGIKALQDRLSALVAEEPIAYADAQAEVMRAAAAEGLSALLSRFGATGSTLLDVLLSMDPDILRTPEDECLYVPPVRFADAVVFLADQLRLPMDRAALTERVERTFEGVMAVEEDQLSDALALLDWQLHSDGMIAGLDYQPVERAAEVESDVPLAQIVPADDGALDVGLLGTAQRGRGFRVMPLPLGTHHRQSEAVARAMGARFVDVDRVLVDAMKAGGIWEDALFFDGPVAADFTWAHEHLEAALEAAIEAPATPDSVTVLGRPCLLGPLGLMHWVSGLYERARGGRYGLIVFAPPADISDGRVKVNRRYPIPYTPDMAAPLVLSAGAAA